MTLCTAASAPAASEPPLAPALGVLPLSPFRIAGGFGETRSNHFHAGLDLSTGGRVGAPVRAPLAGFVERVRASGVGYGRSLYLRTDDGRLLVFGHLDAFAPRVAAYVDSAQRAAGQYEQDLWPAPRRFRFATSDTIAWSGESGGGGPHLHFEIRHQDFALNPVRAGVPSPGSAPPALEFVVLEPIAPGSLVRRGAAPLRLALRPAADTIVVEGDVRVLARANSGMPGTQGTPAWSIAATWGDATVEARLDSISWDGEMAQLDEAIDRGRVLGRDGFVLWAPAGWRPRFLRTSAPLEQEAGVIRVSPGDPPRPLRLRARDAGGLESERVVWLRGPLSAERGPDTTAASTERTAGVAHFEFETLPAGRGMRVHVIDAPAGLRNVRVGREREGGGEAIATYDAQGWCALLPPVNVPDDMGVWVRGTLANGTAWSRRGAMTFWNAGADLAIQPAAFARFTLSDEYLFAERAVYASRTVPAVSPAGLAGVTPVLQLMPARFPLRKAVPLSLLLPPGESIERVGVYRCVNGREWDFVRSRWDSTTRELRVETSYFGSFALMRDEVAPALVLLPAPARASASPYSRWQLVAGVGETGSGIDAAASAFWVDGVRRPSEWDSEENQLRWRPLRAPAPGRHTFEVRVSDRAGNTAIRRGSFVLDSARPRH